MADNNEIKVKSLQKALEILNLFTVKPVLGVTEVSEYFGWYKSTVHNILCTLKSMEYLEQDEETGKYRFTDTSAIHLSPLSKDRTHQLNRFCRTLHAGVIKYYQRKSLSGGSISRGSIVFGCNVSSRIC